VLFSFTDADDDASATLDVSSAYNNNFASLMIGGDALNLPLDDVMPHPSLTLLCDDVAKVIINRPNVFQVESSCVSDTERCVTFAIAS